MHRITLGNTVFEGENNAYLFDGEQTVLVDTGVATPGPREQLEAGLADHGVSFADVDTVFLTHYHADHSGLASAIQEAGGATVYVHPGDAALVEDDEAAWNDLHERQQAYFEEWGMPEEKQSELMAATENNEGYGEEVDTEPFEDGDRFDVGETTFQVMHTPGHTRGLTTFVLTDRNEALTGDALLPVYTPNVGGADVRVERPLEQYLDTLERVADRDFDRAWPGHRDPIEDPSARAEAIIEHHHERAWRVIRTLAEVGPADAWTVSAELFGELAYIHILHGPGEAYAHLEHLARAGDVERVGDEYRLPPETRDRFEAHDGDTWPL